ncbi:hypothetical protein GGR57DRAFT_520264 [Xylariaceae sp. FL1272]|nr:hypothetical protein GGR57DRAFT_520264 [Xylariaceae sp. FL1272]
MADNIRTPLVLGGTPSPTPQTFRLLDLPRELLIVLGENMPAASANILSRTCREIYQLFKKHLQVTEAPLKGWPGCQALSPGALAKPGRWVCETEEDYLGWISSIAREMPNYWVCEICKDLHKIDRDDLLNPGGCPSRPGMRWCPWSSGSIYNAEWRSSSVTLQFQHRHIQVALKATRLRNHAKENYVEEVTRSSCVRLRSSRRSSLNDQFSVFPRIVRDGGELHFVIHTVWRVTEINYKQRSNPQVDTQTIRICPHMWITGSSPHLFQQVRRKEGGAGHETILYSQFTNAVVGWNTKHINCENCPTDVQIRGCENYLGQGWAIYVETWRDFGKEASPLNDIWRSQCSDEPKITRINPHLDVVRNLYESPEASNTQPVSQQSVLESQFEAYTD